jgi:glycosyltransferase involved in cell wall biosynthesis
MDWLPNDDAIRYFIKEIMPLLRRILPPVTLTVVGRNPSAGLIELSKSEVSVKIVGRVEDVRPYMEKAAVYIVPLRIGGGTRLKIYEAMAMEKTIVSTTVGAEGLSVTNGVDLLLADTPQAFADSIVKVLTDENFARGLAQQAAATVREKFSWCRVTANFAEVCEQTLAKRLATPSGTL